MAKPLDPKAIEAERQTSSRAERREQKRRQMQDEISYNQRGNGVIIPPQKRRELAEEPSKLRVAAYCRVSTQEEQQVGSFDMQIHHFTKRIEANPQWELVEIYQDEGISATTVEKRLGFQKMIADAVDGKIDLILTKSISRFGRNIVDILDNLQTLSALNPPVSVEFETEGITYTGDGRNNLLISLLAALAEMESQQKSEAIKAGIRWRMAEGIPPLFCVCWMRKQEYLRSVPARATSRRASSSPSQEANRKVLLRFPTRICLTRFALSPARTGFPASVTGCAGSGLPMQKPCALTLMKGYRRTFALLRRTMMQNNP